MNALDLDQAERRLAAVRNISGPAASLGRLLKEDVPALIADARRVRGLTEDDVAQALVAGSRWSAPWERMTGQEQEWVRQQARPVLALILGADAADVVEFPGPVEFDFTPGGGDAA